MRLDKYLANSGIGSRSEVKRFIKDKRVKVNGEIIRSDSYNVDETKDIVLFDVLEVKYKEFYYILLNKPQGYVSAVIDNVYPPVTDLIPEYSFAKLFPVGRLDVDTTGALLLTNDGELAHKLISPKYHVDKVYEVEVNKKITGNLPEFFKNGVSVEIHRFFASLNDPNHAKLLDDQIIENINSSHVLPDKVNGLVLLEHISQHLESGLGLRQIIDWMMFVNQCLPDEYWPGYKEHGLLLHQS